MNNLPGSILSEADTIAAGLPYMDIPIPIDPVLAKAISRHAMEVNPANLPDNARFTTIELAVAQRWLWRVGTVLRVSFIGTWPYGMKQRVEEVAQRWTRYANLTFDFHDHHPDDADIRIAFMRGFWSYIGLYATKIPPNQPTMDLGGLSLDMAVDQFEGLVLHEFGHAIGCIHEHQSPSAGIQWNKPVVYAYFSRMYSWSKERVDNNVFGTYTKSELRNTSEFDPASIMIYAIPKQLTLDGFEVNGTTALSPGDKQFIAMVYPGRQNNEVPE